MSKNDARPNWGAKRAMRNQKMMDKLMKIKWILIKTSVQRAGQRHTNTRARAGNAYHVQECSKMATLRVTTIITTV